MSTSRPWAPALPLAACGAQVGWWRSPCHRHWTGSSVVGTFLLNGVSHLAELFPVSMTFLLPVPPDVPDVPDSNADQSARGFHGRIPTCDRRAIKSSSGRCVVDNVCGVVLNPGSFACYDTKVERNTALARVRGLRVSRGLPTLPGRLPAALWSRCKLPVGSQTGRFSSAVRIVGPGRWDRLMTFGPDQRRNVCGASTAGH